MTGVPTSPGQMNYKFKDDFYNLKLFVNGIYVEPIQRGRSLTHKVYSDYYTNIQDQTHSGLFMYSPKLLLPNDLGINNKIDLQIYKESNLTEPVSISLREATIKQLLEDFKPYFDHTQLQNSNENSSNNK